MKKENIIIDCDPGHDDAFAIILAIACEKLNILGITTVAGNHTIEKMTKNALDVINMAKKPEIPVYEGCTKPLKVKQVTAGEFHGESGMDGPTNTIVHKFPKRNKHAVEFMKETLENSDEPITIVTLGPMTNVATLLEKYPHVKKNIKRISFMGGSHGSGNWTAGAEYNIAVDPHAADIVFKSKIPLIMSGLEVCSTTGMCWKDVKHLLNNGEFNHYAAELFDFYMHTRTDDDYSFSLFDPNAIAYLIDETIYTSKDYAVDVDVDSTKFLGNTVFDTRPWLQHKIYKNVKVLEKGDSSKFKKLVLDSIQKIQSKY